MQSIVEVLWLKVEKKTDAVADNSGVDGADIGVDKGVGVKCFRKGAICGGPMTKDGKKGCADADKIGVDGADLGVEKGVGVECCRKDANCGGPMIEGGERAGADPYKRSDNFIIS